MPAWANGGKAPNAWPLSANDLGDFAYAVARRFPQPEIHGAHESEVLGVVHDGDRNGRGGRRELVDVLADRKLRRRVVDDQQLERH